MPTPQVRALRSPFRLKVPIFNAGMGPAAPPPNCATPKPAGMNVWRDSNTRLHSRTLLPNNAEGFSYLLFK